MSARLVLASQSPRRHALLAEAAFIFETTEPEVAEIRSRHLSLRELTIANATCKALAVAQENPKAVVLAADTLVAIENEVLGKPCNRRHALMMLRKLSGRVHEVCTGVCIVARGKHVTTFAEISRVGFRKFNDRALRAYLQKVDPLDKAGAYAVQGAGHEIIDSIEGSVTNVVGLPMERIIAELARFQIYPERLNAYR